MIWGHANALTPKYDWKEKWATINTSDWKKDNIYKMIYFFKLFSHVMMLIKISKNAHHLTSISSQIVMQ